MCLLKVFLIIQLCSENFKYLKSTPEASFGNIPCSNRRSCNNYDRQPYQCSLCAENKKGESRCLTTFIDGIWYQNRQDMCLLPTVCNTKCENNGKCQQDDSYIATCFCPAGFYQQNCATRAKSDDVYFHMIWWHRRNAFANPGGFKRFYFMIAVDANFFEKGVKRMFQTGLGNIVNLGESGNRGNAPPYLSCAKDSGPSCIYKYQDYIDLQLPYLLPENDKNVTVLKMKDKLIGYETQIVFNIMTRRLYYTSQTYEVFVDYENASGLKCIPVIQLTNCRSFADVSKSVFHRNENIVMNYNVKYLEDGAYKSTAIENRQKCTSEDTIWTWVWSKCYGRNYYGYDPGEMLEEGRAVEKSRIFNKFTLALGTYRINLRIKRVIRGNTNENFDECFIRVEALPLKAVIDGGEELKVIKNIGFGLTAKKSYDPNEPPDGQGSLMLLWTCECLTKNIPDCENTCKINQKNPLWLTVQKEFYLYPQQLQYNAEYKFTLTVDSLIKYRSKRISPQFDYVIVKVANASVNAVTNYYVQCIQNCVKDAVLSNEVLFVKAKVSVSGKSKKKSNETVQFVWVYSKENDSVLQPVDNILLTEDLPSNMLALKEDALVRGISYTLMLKDKDSSEVLAQYNFKTLPMEYTGSCKIEPQSGVKGLTNFDITCDGFEGLIFEFYDKNEEDLAENLYFNGRMLGTSEFQGVISEVRITRGNIQVYVISKISGLYIRKDLKVELSPWNITDEIMEEIMDNLTSTVNLGDLSAIMSYVSFIPDILPEHVDKHEMLQILLDPISEVELNSRTDVKLSASAMKLVLQTLNKPVPLSIDLGLVLQMLELIKRQSDIIENAVKLRHISQWISTQEVRLVALGMLECLNAALKSESARTAGMIEENLNFDILFLLRRNSEENGRILDNIKDILCYIQAAGLPPVKLTTKDKAFTVWAMGNDEDYPVTEMLKKNVSIPFSVSELLLHAYTTKEHSDTNIFFQTALIDWNVFSWSKSDVKSKLVSLSVAIRRGREFDKVKMLSSPITVRLGMEKNLTNSTVKGSVRQLDPKLDPVTLDLGIPVHKIDLPPKGYLTIRFLYPPTNESLRVLVMEEFRPDYEFMTQSKDVVIVNSSNLEYPIQHRHSDLPMFLYMGVLPHENVKVNQTVEYEFEVAINLCKLWVLGQWISMGCWVSTETTSEETVCACNHLSIFAAAFPVPPQSIDIFEDSKLFLTVRDNPLVVVFVIIIFIIYLILVLWSRYKDKIDRHKGKVEVLADNFPEDSFPYLVAVHTSPRFNAGTTAHVGIKLLGKIKNSRAHILSNQRRRVLTRNSDDWFMIFTPDVLGYVYGIHLWHDNYGSNPEWYCEKIVVYDLTNRTESVFVMEQWLALREGDYVEAKLMLATGQEMLNIKRIFLNNSVLGFRDSHMLLSILTRHPRSEVTRVQRLSVLMCTIMVAMLCSIMFYVPDGGDTRTDDFQYDLGMREVIVSIETLVITAILTMVVFLSFKRSYKVFNEEISTVRQYRKDEVAEAIASNSIKNEEDKLVEYGKTFFENYTRYVSRNLRSPPLTPVYMWEDEKKLKIRKIWYIVAWVSCISVILIAAYLVMLYGLKLGFVQSQKWLTTLVMTVGEDVFVMGPGRIILVAILLSMAFQVSTKVDIHGIGIKDAMLARPKNELNYLNILLANRNHSMYAPLSSSTRQAFIQKKRIRRMWWNLIDFVNAVFFTIIVSIVIFRLWISHYHGVEHLQESFKHMHRIRGKTMHFENINNITMVENYMEFTFIETVFNLWWYNDKPLSERTDLEGIWQYWVEDALHKTVSRPFLRQVRVRPHKCTNKFFMNTTNCLLKWSLGNKDTDVYGEHWAPATYFDTNKEDSPWEYQDRSYFLWWTNERFYGRTGRLYDISGYDLFLGPKQKQASTTLIELRENGWQDMYTRACFLSTTVYNVNYHTFSQVTALFEYFVDGAMYNSITVIPVSRIILFGIWEYLFIFYAVYYVFRSGYLINRMGLLDYLKDLNNLTRVINVFLSFLAFIIWAVHHSTSIKYSETYMKGEANDYFNFDKFIASFRLLQLVLSVLLCFAIARCFMCIRGGRRLLNAYYTFLISLNTVFWLILGFLVLVFVIMRLSFLLYCVEYFRMKELTLPVKMTSYLKLSLFEDLNIQIFVLLRVVVMYFVHAFFLVLYLHLNRIAKAYKLKVSDSFNFVLFVIERVKICFNRKRH